MKSDVPLDYAIFHLTPTRTRCELLVARGKETERLASGLIKPFLTHLKAVEDEISSCSSSSSSSSTITLQPPPTTTCGDTHASANASSKKDPPHPHDAPWFTKGTVERFVRFVSTPEVLEFVSSVEDELIQIEEAISMQAMDPSPPSSSGLIEALLSMTTPASKISLSTTPKSRHNSLDGGVDVLEVPESSKNQLAHAMEAQRLVLHKEQAMAFSRAAAAGFDVQYMGHLLAFADCFGATRLRDACVKFMALCKKRKEACKCIKEVECAAINSARLCQLVSASPDRSMVRPAKDQYADRQSELHANFQVSEASKYDDISSRTHGGLFHDGQTFVNDLDTHAHSEASSQQCIYHHHHQHRSSAPFNGLHGTSTASVPTTNNYFSHGCSAYYHYSSTSMVYNEDDVFIEQSSAEDVCQNGGGLISSQVVMQCKSPPPQLQKHSHHRRFTVDAAGETCIDLGVSRHRQGHCRSWARHSASHLFPPCFSLSSQSANSSSSSNCHLYDPDGDYIYPLESFEPNSFQGSQLGPHLNQDGSVCVNGNGSESCVQNLSPTTLASDQNWQHNSRCTGLSGIFHNHAQDQQNTQRGGCCGHFTTTHMQRKNAVAMDTACSSPVSRVITETTGDEILEHESQSPSKLDTAAAASNSDPSQHLIPVLPSPKQKMSAVQKPMQARCSSGVKQQQHPANVVPRSINYKSLDSVWSSAERMTLKDFEGSGTVDDSDHSLSKKQDEKDDCHNEAPCRSLSVKDAISLFEIKREDGIQEFKKKLQKQQEPHIGSTDAPRTPSFVFEKPVLRRWSQVAAGNNSDCSHTEMEQQSKDLCCNSPQDSHPQDCTTMIDILPESHPPIESFCPGVKTVVSDTTMIAAGMHGEISRMSVDSVLAPDSLLKDSATRSGLLCSSGPNSDSSSFYQEAHVEENSVATVQSEGAKTMTIVKDKELVHPEHPCFMMDASNATVASRASAEDNSSNQFRTGTQSEVELADDDQQISILKVSNSTSENNPSILPASDTDVGPLAMNSVANQKSGSGLHHENNGNVKHVVSVMKGEINSPQGPKGRFYEHYRERRDAKLREEPGSKRAEREAQLKTMQEVLEKRKEEMAAHNNNNFNGKVPEKLHSVSADPHLHGEKLHKFKPELAISRKSKEDEDKKLVDDMRVRQRERPVVASRSSPTLTASSTPRAAASQHQQLSSPKQNVVQKLSSPQKFSSGLSLHVNMNVMSPAAAAGVPKLSSHAASQWWSATAPNSTTAGEIPLSHSSVPCLAQLRKENTKPLAARSSTLHERRPLNKTINGPMLHSYTAPLESNRSQPAAVVSFNIYEDKKNWNSGIRRSLSSVSTDLLPEAPSPVSQTPLKISKYLMVEQNTTNKPMKHMSSANCQATPDAKPFLRKGRGIGPGAGAAGLRKSKVVPGSLDPAKSFDEDVAIVTSLSSEVVADSADLSMDALKSEHNSATQVAVEECNKQAAGETSSVTCCIDPIYPPLQIPNAFPLAMSNSTIELTQDTLKDHGTETDQASPASFEVHAEDYSYVHCPRPASYTGSSLEEEPQLLDTLHEVSPICTSPVLEEACKKSSSPGMPFLQTNYPPSTSPPTSTPCIPISPSNAPEAPILNTVADKTSVESPPAPHIQSSPLHLPLFTSSPKTPFCERESCDALWVLAASPGLSPSGVKHDDNNDDELPHLGVPNSPPLCEAHSCSLVEEVLSSQSASPPVSQSVPALEASLSPQASVSSHGTTAAARSRRKWGSAEKVPPPIIMMSKESPKGIRKLLKFGRKSRSGCSFSSSTANDWRETASTTTASDADDADLELNNRMSFSNLTKRLERSWKNGGTQLHKGIRSVSAVQESSSSLPSLKTVHGAATQRSNYAPRSFFSLSTFRSKSNEPKSRY